MTEDLRIARAEARVDAARAQLIGTLQDIAHQLEPRRLLGELWEDAKVKGADLAEDAVDAVKARPLAATGIAAAITMFLARHPIIDLAGRALGGKRRKKEAPEKGDGKSPGRKPPARKAAAKPARSTRSSKVEKVQ